MSKVIKEILLVFIFSTLLSTAYAQYKDQVRVYHGYEWPSETWFYGINFTGEFFPINYFSIAPSFTLFVPSTGNARAYDINARYYFTEKERQWYGTFGYGHYTRVYEFNPIGRISTNSVNIGGGGVFKINDEIGINPEIRYQPIQRNEMIFKISILYFVN
ncbi:hypothetical protein [Mongoliibacter ruber]|uniref:Outer membrane protein with beta-barrel domain n=1 Tax=Mongoliibacter ruber TaxID=1750599 RepID=A0A2T0WG62_9BACT|nr:hypothetical protein [Mongoliibacter ruber]PRY85697.1 hypothetical protein CLW00_11139 [Mongoliibacter ruber]